MTTNKKATGTKLALIAGAALWLFAGCAAKAGASGSTHTLVDGLSEQVSAGGCAAVEGPYAVPDGASMDYTVTDIDDTDDMDVAIIADAAGCSFSAGFGVALDVASVKGGDDNLPGDSYDFVVRCNNGVLPCQFSLDWSATY